MERIRLGLKDLNFLDVQFEMKFTRLLECREDGIDEPEFLVSMNPGEPLRPLGHGGIWRRIVEDHACDQNSSRISRRDCYIDL